MATKQQIRKLYGLAAGAGLVEANNKNDLFHTLVYGITGKAHVSDLTDKEVAAVQAELISKMRYKNHDAPIKKRKKTPATEIQPGMMTAKQIGLAWRLIYRLQELDENPRCKEDGTVYSTGERMAGAIKKELGVTANIAGNDPNKPFRWVSFENGEKLIEALKRYVRSAERKAKKKEGVG